MSQDWIGLQRGTMRTDLSEAITQLGLDYRLMTQFTSFVAVEEMTVTDGGQPRRIEVPVEMPEGVSYQGVFGGAEVDAAGAQSPGVIGGVVGGVAAPPAFAQRAAKAMRYDGPAIVEPGRRGAALQARPGTGRNRRTDQIRESASLLRGPVRPRRQGGGAGLAERCLRCRARKTEGARLHDPRAADRREDGDRENPSRETRSALEARLRPLYGARNALRRAGGAHRLLDHPVGQERRLAGGRKRRPGEHGAHEVLEDRIVQVRVRAAIARCLPEI